MVKIYPDLRSPLVSLKTLCVSDLFRCGAVSILISLVRTSRHFVRVRPPPLWCGATSDMACTAAWTLCTCSLSPQGAQVLTSSSWVETACTEILSKELFQICCCNRDISKRTCLENSVTETLCRNLLRVRKALA